MIIMEEERTRVKNAHLWQRILLWATVSKHWLHIELCWTNNNNNLAYTKIQLPFVNWDVYWNMDTYVCRYVSVVRCRYSFCAEHHLVWEAFFLNTAKITMLEPSSNFALLLTTIRPMEMIGRIITSTNAHRETNCEVLHDFPLVVWSTAYFNHFCAFLPTTCSKIISPQFDILNWYSDFICPKR